MTDATDVAPLPDEPTSEHLPEYGEPGSTFVQWKGTDLCMDFVCPACEEDSHYDGRFAHVIRCGHCGALFRLGTKVTVTPTATAGGYTPRDPISEEG